MSKRFLVSVTMKVADSEDGIFDATLSAAAETVEDLAAAVPRLLAGHHRAMKGWLNQEVAPQPQRSEAQRPAEEPRQAGKPAVTPPAKKGAPQDNHYATESQVKMINTKLRIAGIPHDAFKERMGVPFIEKIPFDRVNEALSIINGWGG